METLVHKPSAGDRNASDNPSPNVRYASMSNANASPPKQGNTTPQPILPQPARVMKTAKPVRDSAQSVSED